MIRSSIFAAAAALFLPVLASACTPTVKVEAPSEPIQINMNVKIEHEIKVKVERDLEQEFAANPELFGVPAARKQ